MALARSTAVLFCILGHLAPPLAAQPRSQSYVESFRDAHRLLAAGELAPARSAFEAALHLRPEAAGSAYGLACIASRSGDFEEAARRLEQACAWGFDDLALATWDPDLVDLRKRPEWSAHEAAIRKAHASRSEFAPELAFDWRFRGMAPRLNPDGTRLLVGRGGRGYLYGVDVQELTAVLSRNGEDTVWAEFTNDGRYVVRSTDKERFEVWDGWSGRFLHELEGPGWWQAHVVVGAAGTRVLGFGPAPNAGAAVWEIASGRLVFRFPGPSPMSAVLSPDGTRAITVSREGMDESELVVWDVDSGATLATHGRVGMPMHQAEYSADGALAFAMGHPECRPILYDGKSGKELRRLGPEDQPVVHARFVPGTRALLAQTRANVLLWIDVDSGEVTRTVSLPSLGWGLLSVDPTGRHVVVSAPLEPWTGVVRTELRDVRTGELRWHRERSNDFAYISGIAFRPDGESLVVTDGSGTVEVLDSGTGRSLVRVRAPAREVAPIAGMETEGCTLVVEGEGLRRIDLTNGRTLGAVAFADADLDAVESGANGARILVGRPDGSATIHAGDTLERICALEPFRGENGDWGCGARFSADGKRLARWRRGAEFGVWSAVTGAQERVLPLEGGDVLDVAWSRDGRLLAAADYEGSAQVWDATTGAPVGPRIRHPKPVETVSFDSTGARLFTGARDAIARAYEVGKDAVLFELSHAEHDLFGDLSVGCIDVAPDGKSVLTATHTFGSVACWSTEDGKRLWAYEYDGGNPADLHAHFDPKGERMAAFGQGNWTPRIVDAKSGAIQVPLADRHIQTLAFSASGSRLVAGMWDSLQVLDAKDGTMRYERVELEGGNELLRTRSMHVDGTPTALRRVQVLCEGRSYPLDSFAPLLLDPKRVRAAAAGVELVPAIVRVPPECFLEGPASGSGSSAGGRIRCEARAEYDAALLGFEVERDGEPIDGAVVRAATKLAEDGRGARIVLDVSMPEGRSVCVLRICAVSRAGLSSRPVFARFTREKEK